MKRGQIEMSFGVIVAIGTIISFLAFGFFAITKFIELQQSIQIENFLKEFQEDVDKMWKSPQGSQPLEYALPKKISEVCFEEDEFQNLNFKSEKIIPGKMIEHLDMEKTLEGKKSLCIENIDDKVKFRIEKEYGETLIKIRKI